MERSVELDYLRKRQENELDILNENISQIEGFKQDYKSLRDRVEVLPHKTRHDVMIPIAGSKLAFMPGYLHHTNEFMVMIGEDYFVEMSAKQTVEFVDRRMKFCDEKLKEMNDNKKLLSDWIKMSTETLEEVSEAVDFVHEETEEEYNEWIKNHQNLMKVNVEKPKKTDEKDKMNIMKFLDKYKDEDDESNDSDDEPIVPTLKKPSPIGIPQNPKPQPLSTLKPAELSSSVAPISEHTSIPKPEPSTSQQYTRQISKFRASRMKQ